VSEEMVLNLYLLSACRYYCMVSNPPNACTPQ